MAEATIIILTPVTTNGLNNVMSDDGRMVYRESEVPAGQRAKFEKINLTLPDNLKYRFKDVIPSQPAKPAEPTDLEKKVAELEAQLALSKAVEKQAVTPRGDNPAPAGVETKPNKNEKAVL